MDSLATRHTINYKDPQTGLIEVVDIMTGDVVARQKPDSLEMQELICTDKNKYQYSELVVDLILQEIMEGKSLKAVSEMDGFPPMPVLIRWRTAHPEFTDQLNEAYQARAEHHYDKAMNPDPKTKDEVPAARFNFDKHKWAAEKDYPDRYGQKTKVEGSGFGNIIIETGIRDPGDTGFNKDCIDIGKEGLIDAITHQSQAGEKRKDQTTDEESKASKGFEETKTTN